MPDHHHSLSGCSMHRWRQQTVPDRRDLHPDYVLCNTDTMRRAVLPHHAPSSTAATNTPMRDRR